MERKLGAIPVAFILVRIWGTLQFVFTSIIFAFNGVDQSGCVAKPVYYALYFFACIQVKVKPIIALFIMYHDECMILYNCYHALLNVHTTTIILPLQKHQF